MKMVLANKDSLFDKDLWVMYRLFPDEAALKEKVEYAFMKMGNFDPLRV